MLNNTYELLTRASRCNVSFTARTDVGGAEGRQGARPVQQVSVGIRTIGGGGTRATRLFRGDERRFTTDREGAQADAADATTDPTDATADATNK